MNKTSHKAPDVNRVMEQLIIDHKNLSHLLTLLEKKFALHVSEADGVDDANSTAGNALPMILETMEYISLYPQKWHHPAEEAAFELLMKKSLDEKSQAAIEKVRSQHRQLEQDTNELNEYFGRIAQDSIIPLEELSEKFSSYLKEQSEHLEAENRLVFPLMMTLLDDKDWETVQKRVIPNIDPLFKERSKYEYKTLSKLLDDYKMSA